MIIGLAALAVRSYGEVAPIDLVLVLVGSEDEAFVADAYPAVFAEHAPHARVERIEGASHLGLVAHPETAARSVGWLRALSSAEAARRADPGATGGEAAAMR